MTNEETLLLKILQALEGIRGEIRALAKENRARDGQLVRESRKRSKLAGKMLSEGLTDELVRRILNG